MAGVAALFELDIKKVIALSTLRQLGIIFFSLGISYPFLSSFILVANIRLCGLPFLSGFYSKDLILEVVF